MLEMICCSKYVRNVAFNFCFLFTVLSVYHLLIHFSIFYLLKLKIENLHQNSNFHQDENEKWNYDENFLF